MPPLLGKEKMDSVDYDDESDHDPISTQIIENIRDGSQSHQNINDIEARYKICGRINQGQSE